MTIRKTKYEQYLGAINALSHKEVKMPTVPPVGVLVQEAFDLCVWAEDDLSTLINCGMEKNALEELNDLAHACSYAHSLWFNERLRVTEHEIELQLVHNEAKKLYKELIHEFTFAFSNRSDLLSALKNIKKGNSLSDLVQDLHNMATLGEGNLALLKRINFDESHIGRAREISETLGSISGTVNAEEYRKTKALDVRNRAYILLANKLAEIRKIGKFAFRNNPDRQRGYQLQYLNKQKRKE